MAEKVSISTSLETWNTLDTWLKGLLNPKENHIHGQSLCLLQQMRQQVKDDSGRISDNPEKFFAQWLRNRAQDIEDGIYTAEGLNQSWSG